MIELVARNIFAEPIACVLGEPVVAGARIDVAADTVANSQRDDFRVPFAGLMCLTWAVDVGGRQMLQGGPKAT